MRKIELSAKAEALGQHLYENTPTPNETIAAILRVSDRTLYRLARERSWTKCQRSDLARTGSLRAGSMAPDAASAPGAQALAGLDADRPDRRSLVAQMRELLGDRIAVLRRQLQEHDPDPAGTTRTLAALARTTRILEQSPERAPDPVHETETPPRSIHELRDELARRLARIRQEEAAHQRARRHHGGRAPDDPAAVDA